MLFGRQHVSVKEDESYEESSADKEEIAGSGDTVEEEEKHITEAGTYPEENATASAPLGKPRNLIKMVLEESKDAEREEKLGNENNEENSGLESGSSASFVQGDGETVLYHEEEHPIPKLHPKNVPQVSNSTSAKDIASESEPLHKETQLNLKDQVGETDDDAKKKSATSKSRSKTKVEIKSKDSKTKVHKDQSLNKEKAKEERSKDKSEHTPQVQDAKILKKNTKKAPIKVSKVSHLAKKRFHHKYITAHVTHPHVAVSHSKAVHKMPVSKGMSRNIRNNKNIFRK